MNPSGHLADVTIAIRDEDSKEWSVRGDTGYDIKEEEGSSTLKIRGGEEFENIPGIQSGKLGHVQVTISKETADGDTPVTWMVKAQTVEYSISAEDRECILKIIHAFEEEDPEKNAEIEERPDDTVPQVTSGPPSSTKRRKGKCVIPGCTAGGRRNVAEPDVYGPAGIRCHRHGGSLLCTVIGCREKGNEQVSFPDHLGRAGKRCTLHYPDAKLQQQPI